MNMKNHSKRVRLFLLLVVLTLIPVSNAHAASKARKVVKKARAIYKDVNKKIKKKKMKKVKSGGCTDYYEKNTIRMTKCLETSNAVSPKKCKVEFYYDKHYHPIFVFAWKKVKGKVKEYRAYFWKDRKCYRYIGPDKKVHTYKKGKDNNMPSMAADMLLKAQMNLHYLGIY